MVKLPSQSHVWLAFLSTFFLCYCGKKVGENYKGFSLVWSSWVEERSSGRLGNIVGRKVNEVWVWVTRRLKALLLWVNGYCVFLERLLPYGIRLFAILFESEWVECQPGCHCYSCKPLEIHFSVSWFNCSISFLKIRWWFSYQIFGGFVGRPYLFQGGISMAL